MFARLRGLTEEELGDIGLTSNTVYWINITVGEYPQELIVKVGDHCTLKYATYHHFTSFWEKF